MFQPAPSWRNESAAAAATAGAALPASAAPSRAVGWVTSSPQPSAVVRPTPSAAIRRKLLALMALDLRFEADWEHWGDFSQPSRPPSSRFQGPAEAANHGSTE